MMEMMEISAKSPRSFGERCYALNVAAHAVRQRATRDGRDIEGWRLSRRMREAETDTQVNVATTFGCKLSHFRKE
jgi:hypothetical protein